MMIGPAVMALCLAGCIKNDLPYPRIQANFSAFVVEQMASPAVIDTTAFTVTLPMAEEADLSAVKVLSYEVSPSQVILSPGHTVPTTLDLTSPWKVELQLYQTYTWTITATQNIERYFTVEGQIGASVIDVPGRKVVAYVPETADLSAIRVASFKIGARGALTEPDLQGKVVDFMSPVKVSVTTHGHTEDWTVYVEPTEAAVTLTSADAWSRVAWIYASAGVDARNGFEYRLAGEEDWTAVPADWITVDGGELCARLIHLQPETEYEVRAYSDDEYTAPVKFITEGEAQMPNSNFSQWWKNGAVWNPWSEDGVSFWDTGNKGAATLGNSNSIPTSATLSGTGQCAELQSKFVGVAGIGKLAAGNIFTGEYFKTDGTNGILHMGREWSLRPTRLIGYMHYNCAPISSVGSDPDFRDWRDRPDTANIYILLADWIEPFEVRTNPKNRQLIDPSAPEIIAYGSVQYGETIENWTKFTIDLDYRSTSRVPRYVLVVASASKYGDYFVGGNGSVLYLDNFRLEYDY